MYLCVFALLLQSRSAGTVLAAVCVPAHKCGVGGGGTAGSAAIAAGHIGGLRCCGAAEVGTPLKVSQLRKQLWEECRDL